jgi:large subunit ribosomal protein L9
MAKQRKQQHPTRRRDRKGPPGSTRRKPCPYCRDKVEQVDYKDVATLRRFVSDRGKIRSRRITGACRRHQSQIARAVKRARELSLLHYVAEDRGGGRERDRNRDRDLVPQAILLQDVDKLGERGAVVDVSPGYLRNYLIPRKLAQPATKGALEAALARQEAAERTRQEAADRAQENAALLTKTVLTIPEQAGEDGRLFGSVTAQDIVDAIRDARGIRVDKRKVHLEEPIRHVGTHMVVVEVADEVTATIKTMVVAR